ncbi:UDP-glycosyltransferase UGT5-like [Rhynchophorus ferrugineus]|uniref:UDP-glycosyltransferase UGT5-like n=1 Tax=Rhynchophorus ferrugineus TaxID=354439 RepID=UPI003FCDCDAA
MSFRVTTLLLWVTCLVQCVYSYNILVVFPYPGKSHVMVYEPLVQELGNRGHNITVITHVPVTNNTTKNVREILIGQPMQEAITLDELSSSPTISALISVFMISYFGKITCQEGLSNPLFQSFLKENNNFDVILVEFFNNNCYLGLPNRYKAPFIGFSTCGMMPWHPGWLGSSQNPSTDQVLLNGFKHPMTFWNRVENTLEHIFSVLWYKYNIEPAGRRYSQQFIGEDAADPHQASLLLVNSHHTLHGARPLTPSIIEVGGIHITNKKVKPLPKILENWINNSDAGVIYFSLGSMIKGDTFPSEKRRAFIGAFARLRQRVLWKWENDTMPDKPDNVMIYKWMPQFDILCNPKAKLFISHCGLLGITEAIHCGIPTIVMPQFGDQRHNAHYLERSGGGLMLILAEATEEKLFNAIQTLLKPENQEKAKELSRRFKDRPLSPMDTAIYWIEHVARNKGGNHMRSTAIDLPFYQYFLLDVIAFLFIGALIYVYISFKVIKATLELINRKSVNKENIRKKTL